MIEKYSDLEPSCVKAIYDYNNRNPVLADFELKEMSTDPSLSKKSTSTNQKAVEEQEMSEEEKPITLVKSVSHQQTTSPKIIGESPQMTETSIGEMIADFKENHKSDHISKQELEAIVDVVREGVRGIDYNEEKFLRSQFTSDLLLLQAFIHAKTMEIIKASYVDNGVNIHNREEFPSLGDSFEGKKKNKGKQTKKKVEKDSPSKNLLDELVADKRAKENELKTEELVNPSFDEPSQNLIPAESQQPLSKWLDYEENLFAMGNVG